MTVPPPGRRARRRATVATATAVAAAALAPYAHVGPAAAAPRCDPETGVRVVVDQGPLGGGTSVRCVEDASDRSVAEVMAQAGVDITWVQRYPGAFVCRLDGRPRDLPCADTPPPDRFWGLFWAGPGDEGWTYASEGAGSLTVPGGGAVGWRFQDGQEREDPARVPGAVPTGSSEQPGRTDSGAGTTRDADAGLGGRSTLLGLLVVAGLGAAGLLVVRRRT